MTIEEIMSQLSSIKRSSANMANGKDADSFWQADVDACEAAISILNALQDEGVTDAESVLDLLHDYNILVNQYRIMHKQYEVSSKPLHSDGVWLCPACNKRTSVNHSFCHWCGKKLRWG